MRISSTAVGECTVLRLHGELDTEGALVVRRALRKAIAHQPDAVIVDLADCPAASRTALRVFPSVARRETSWPGTALLLAAAVPVVAEELRRGATAQFMGVHDTVAEAVEASRTSPARLREVLHLGASPLAPSTARRFARQTLAEWGVVEELDAALLVASELVTNAVVHVGEDLVLSLELGPRTLHVGVTDHGRTPLGLVREGAGCGLLVVDRLTAAMGSVALPHGKLVWAVLRRDPDPGRRSPRDPAAPA